jgi:hypothetical protein
MLARIDLDSGAAEVLGERSIVDRDRHGQKVIAGAILGGQDDCGHGLVDLSKPAAAVFANDARAAQTHAHAKGLPRVDQMP